MKQTFVPKHKYAKAFGTDMRISTKSAQLICRVMKNKPLTRARRLLEDLAAERRSLDGKHYTRTARAMLGVVGSCEKNAEFLGLDADRLFVHASAHMGPNIRRRRRKGAFGSKLKSTHIEVMLIERGKEQKDKVPKKKIREQLTKDANGVAGSQAEKAEIKRGIEELKEEQKQLEEDVKEAEKEVVRRTVRDL